MNRNIIKGFIDKDTEESKSILIEPSKEINRLMFKPHEDGNNVFPVASLSTVKKILEESSLFE